MRDVPRRPNPGDETETSETPKASQDNSGQPSEARTENTRSANEPVRRPGGLPAVDPKGLQALLVYRDERARAEARLLRARRLEHDDRPRADVPEPDDPPPADPTPPGRSTADGKSKQANDPAAKGNPTDEHLRRAGHARRVDPEGLQALLDYRDQRASAEAKLGRAKQREYDDRRRMSLPEPDDPSTPAPPSGSRQVLGHSPSTATDSSPSGAEHRETRESSLHPTEESRSEDMSPPRPRPVESASSTDQGVDTREPELVDLVEAGRRAVEQDPGKDRASNRVRPPRDGDTNYVVEDPSDRSNTITDIDLVMGGTLWEIKKTTGQNPRMKPDEWAATEVPRKLDKYVEARRHLEGYESAPIGLLFVASGATEHLHTSVNSAVAAWRERNPGESVKVRWAP